MRRYSNYRNVRKAVCSVAVVLGVLACTAIQASAQDFSSFNPVTLDGGATFSVNGTQVDSGNLFSVLQPGTDNVDFGFSSFATPITVTLANNTTVQITGIDMVALISNVGHGDLTATTPGKNSTAAILDYMAHAAGTWSGGTTNGSKFPDYAAKDFGSANFLRGGSEAPVSTDPATGQYDFGGVQTKPTGSQMYLGFHGRIGGANGQTEFMYIDGVSDEGFHGSGGPLTPEGHSGWLLAFGLIPVGIFAINTRRRSTTVS